MVLLENYVAHETRRYERIRYGAETWWKPEQWYHGRVKEALQPSCLVCSTGIGYLHQPGCSLEECPVHRARRLADHDHDEPESS